MLQEFKQHPFVAKLLEGGKMIRYGAKSLPYGGWWAMPPVAGNGWMILGDSAGFLNSQRLKGIHLAIKSGMLAAETAFEAMSEGRFLGGDAGAISGDGRKQLDQGGAVAGAQFPSGLRAWLLRGMFHAGIQQFTGGRGLRNRYPSDAGLRAHEELARSAGRWRRTKRIASDRPRATAS